MKRKQFLWIFIGLFVMAATACGTDQEDDSTPEDTNETDNGETTESADLYDQIIEEGHLTVGTEGTYAPFTFHNKEGELTGYDVEIIREVADRIGVEVEFEETQWDSMFAGLNAERFDLIANQVGINEDRLENYDFSHPYTYTAAVVVVPENNDDIESFADVEGHRSAQSLTSNFGKLAEEHGAELESVEGLAQSIELIKQGRADITINDKLAVLNYMNEQNDDSIKIAAEEENASKTAFAFRKGNEKFVEAVNEQLEAMKEDGTLADISEEWFGEDVSTR